MSFYGRQHELELLEEHFTYGPYFRQGTRERKRRPGVQIDLLILRRDNVVAAVENKFTREPVGSAVMDETQAKIEKLDFPKTYTVEKVLISSSGATTAVSNSGYFNKIITLDESIGS